MASKHTPGPWHAGGWDPTRLRVTVGAHPAIDVAYVLGSRETREATEADARLIAAAPDLLAALQLFVEGFDPEKDYEGVYAAFEDKARIARAAIAKAEVA